MAKIFAFFRSVVYGLRYVYVSIAMRINPTRHIFTAIFHSNAWGSAESVSGPGSDLQQTQILTQALPVLLHQHAIKTLVDVPCGDFHWMNTVDLTGIQYIGADIVKPLIQKNKQQYQRDNIKFQTLNLIKHDLPSCDAVLCRDCLVHFSLQDIFAALENIIRSEAVWLLTTHFPQKTANHNIMTGDWRPLNFTLAPFNFPPPVHLIQERCTEADGAYQDKTLALWRVADIKQAVLNVDKTAITTVPINKQQQVALLLKHCNNSPTLDNKKA